MKTLSARKLLNDALRDLARASKGLAIMKKVLIADDDAALRRLMRATLEGEEYEILEATGGAQMLSVARERHPDLILLDVPMPDCAGIEMCRTLKTDPATSHVTIITLATDLPGDVQSSESGQIQLAQVQGEQLLAAGADHHLTKPFSPVELLKLAESVPAR